MTKSIVGIFQRRNDADNAAQDLVRQGIPAERISLLYGGEYDTTERSREVHADEAVGSVAAAGGAALAGLISFAIPAVGTVLGTSAVVAALGAKTAAEANDPNSHLRHVLQTMGLMDEQTEVYANVCVRAIRFWQ